MKRIIIVFLGLVFCFSLPAYAAKDATAEKRDLIVASVKKILESVDAEYLEKKKDELKEKYEGMNEDYKRYMRKKFPDIEKELKYLLEKACKDSLEKLDCYDEQGELILGLVTINKLEKIHPEIKTKILNHINENHPRVYIATARYIIIYHPELLEEVVKTTLEVAGKSLGEKLKSIELPEPETQ